MALRSRQQRSPQSAPPPGPPSRAVRCRLKPGRIRPARVVASDHGVSSRHCPVPVCPALAPSHCGPSSQLAAPQSLISHAPAAGLERSGAALHGAPSRAAPAAAPPSSYSASSCRRRRVSVSDTTAGAVLRDGITAAAEQHTQKRRQILEM